MTKLYKLLIFHFFITSFPAEAEVVDYPTPTTYASEGRGETAFRSTLVIDGAFDLEAFKPLVTAFQDAFPAISVIYHDLHSNDLYERFIEQVDSGHPDSPDLLISSAMDLQLKLVNDGYALRHDSSAVDAMPDWAVWRNEAFGFSFEPAVIVYNKEQVPEEDVPRTRADLTQLLRNNRDRYFGKVATYDPERSGVGFLFLTQDAEQSYLIWDLVRAFGASGVKLFNTTDAMLDRIASGELLIGYNLLGSYAFAEAQQDPRIGIVFPRDYTLVMSRIAIIPKTNSRPELARLFVDFLLSRRGQQVIAETSYLYSIHPQVTGKTTAEALKSLVGEGLRPIRLGPGLLVYLDQVKRRNFLRGWQRTLGGR